MTALYDYMFNNDTHVAFWKYRLTLEASATCLVAHICLMSGLRELQMKSNSICMIFLVAHLGLIRWMGSRKGKELKNFSGRKNGWIRNLHGEFCSPHYPAYIFSSCNLSSMLITKTELHSDSGPTGASKRLQQASRRHAAFIKFSLLTSM